MVPDQRRRWLAAALLVTGSSVRGRPQTPAARAEPMRRYRACCLCGVRCTACATGNLRRARAAGIQRAARWVIRAEMQRRGSGMQQSESRAWRASLVKASPEAPEGELRRTIALVTSSRLVQSTSLRTCRQPTPRRHANAALRRPASRQVPNAASRRRALADMHGALGQDIHLVRRVVPARDAHHSGRPTFGLAPRSPGASRHCAKRSA